MTNVPVIIMSLEQFYFVALLKREFILSFRNIVPYRYQIMGHVIEWRLAILFQLQQAKESGVQCQRHNFFLELVPGCAVALFALQLTAIM